VSDSATILSKPVKPVPVSGDMLLPLIIFSVVKANPSHLVSHLLYIQRFRNKSVGGEESYCLINLLAVAEFLENVDLAALGLADSETKVLRYSEWYSIALVRIYC
jgi:Vacuolar sorting protein 9 (VPS9) domain